MCIYQLTFGSRCVGCFSVPPCRSIIVRLGIRIGATDADSLYRVAVEVIGGGAAPVAVGSDAVGAGYQRFGIWMGSLEVQAASGASSNAIYRAFFICFAKLSSDFMLNLLQSYTKSAGLVLPSP